MNHVKVNTMLYTTGDTQIAKRDKSKNNEFKISNGVLYFNNDTTELQFVSLTDREEIKEIRFTVPQPELRYLDVSRCNVEKIHFSTHCCPQLKSLYLHHNNLAAIEFNTQFPQLQLLDLSFNENLTEIEIGNANITLPKLKYLYSHKCKLGNLQAFARFFINEGNDFNIEENEELRLPPEAIVSQGKVAIRDYFKQKLLDEEKGEIQQYLYEAKLLVLGDPRAGKTTLATKIVDPAAPMPEDDATTRGIELGKWTFSHHFEGKEEEGKGIQKVTVNIWDFGGQAIYKQAHRFFLTQRSLYVLLSDAGAAENTDFRYWLHTTKVFGEKCPIVIVINEKDGRKFTVPFDTFCKINNCLKEQAHVDLNGADTSDRKRFNETLDLLKSQLSSLKHLGDLVPSSWKKIRKRIAEKEDEGSKVIRADEYETICSEFGLEEKNSQNNLAQYFHDIGVFLFFQKDVLLRKTIFLDKKWILNAAYIVYDSPLVEQKKGRLTNREFNELLHKDYQGFIPEIKALLKRFHIIYEKGGFFVVPQKLPEEKQYQWDAVNTVSFVFSYNNYMPAGILWQFIVDLKDKIKDELVWRYGVILKNDDGTEVLVREKYGEDKIYINVSGPDKVDTRAVIINKIEEINKSYGNLNVNKLVPCDCSDCQEAQNQGDEPEYFKYQVLKDALRKGDPEQKCDKSRQNRSITKLLEGVDLNPGKETDKKTSTTITGENVTVVIGDSNTTNTKQENPKGSIDTSPPPQPTNTKRKWWKIALSFFVLIFSTGLYWIFTPFINDFNWWKPVLFLFVLITCTGLYWYYKPFENDFNWWAKLGGIIIAVIAAYGGFLAVFRD